MTKTRRMIAEQIKNVDAVCEILDARIPVSSRNPDVDELTAGKPRLVVLNRVDQADPDATKRWAAWFRAKGYAVMESDANANIKPNKKKSSNKIDPAVSALMAFGTFQVEHEDFAFDMSDSHKQRLATFNGI